MLAVNQSWLCVLERTYHVTSKQPIPLMTYTSPPATSTPAKQLVAFPGTPEEQRFTFYDRIEIGRYSDQRKNTPGVLLVLDPTVSSRHCVITQTADGRCHISDTSRNGTRVDGRRLVPNMEIELRVSQSIALGNHHEFLLAGEVTEAAASEDVFAQGGTLSQMQSITVTALVGDIGNYSALVQKVDPIVLQRAMRRVFHRLENEVIELGGAVKEFRGDAIFAYWEELHSENQAIEACRAALRLCELGRELATDASVWDIAEYPLRMEWALATGPVTIDTIGDDRPTGLTMVGRPVVLAFRLEKFASNETSPVVTCADTQERAWTAFEFADLGEKRVKGFDDPVKVFALIGPR